jgi:cell division septation protein DedD
MQQIHLRSIPTLAGIGFILRRQPLLLAACGATIVVGMHWGSAARGEAVQAAAALKHLEPSTILAALALSILAALLSGAEWQRLIVQFGYSCTYRTGLRTYLSAGLGGYLLNGIGPAVGCAASLQAHGVTARRAALLTIIANILGLCGVLVWAPIGILILARSADIPALPILGTHDLLAGAAALLALAVALIVLLYVLARATRTQNRVARFLLGPAPDGERREAGILHCRRLLALLPWTAASWVVGACALYVFLGAMHHGGAPSAIAVIGSAALASTLGSLACFAPEGLGVSEGVLVVMLVHVTTIPAADCISAALAMRTLDPLAKLSLLGAMALSGNVRNMARRAAARRPVPAVISRGTLAFVTPAATVAAPSLLLPASRPNPLPLLPRRLRDRRDEAAALFIELEDHENNLLLG